MPASVTVPSARTERIPACSRPVVRYHGGKWRLARWIIAHMPPHRVYVDPPYPADTRSTGLGAYGRECTDDAHRRLADVLHSIRGMVLVSGYPCPLYDELFGDWPCVGCTAMADKNARRLECLWLNPAAAAAASQRDLFWEAS